MSTPDGETLTTSPAEPPVDFDPFSPTLSSDSFAASEPAFETSGEDDHRVVPSVSVEDRGVKASRSADGHDRRSSTSGAVSRSASIGAVSGLGIAGYPPRLRPVHHRTLSSPSHSAGSTPRQLPGSPLLGNGPAVVRVALPESPSTTKSDYTPAMPEPLDLGVELASVPSTYHSAQAGVSHPPPHMSREEAGSGSVSSTVAAEAPEPVEMPSPSRSEDEPGTPYAAQVRVSIAQRVERAPSPRKGSLAELSSKRSSSATTLSIASRHAREHSIYGPAGPTRPIERIPPPLYLPSSQSSSIDGSVSSCSSSQIPAPVGNGPGGQVLTPGVKLPLNLVSLSRRTAHVSDAPGYAWRLNLLEKLEIILGSFFSIEEAEAILSIGRDNLTSKRATRGDQDEPEARLPPLTAENASKDRGSLLGRFKRALPNLGKDGPPPPATKKAVFGAPLAQGYGFVTSMIAGQRHELPGVVFSTVEEIYRRGQGKKVPGMLQQQGEPSRVAKLVQIYDSPPDYGEHHDLSIESIHNVVSLLKRYLRELPEPVLDRRLWRLLLTCIDSDKLHAKARVAAVQIVLRLQPTVNFSLVTYILAFLSQIPLFPENSLSINEIVPLFSTALMAPRTLPRSKKAATNQLSISGPTEPLSSGVETANRAQDALRFLLNHWSAIADGLLEPDFDVDPAKIVNGFTEAPASSTIEGYYPDEELHIRTNDSAVEPIAATDANEMLIQLAPPREAPAPPFAALPWSAHRVDQIPPVLPLSMVKNGNVMQNGSGSTFGRFEPSTAVSTVNDSPPSPRTKVDIPFRQQSPDEALHRSPSASHRSPSASHRSPSASHRSPTPSTAEAPDTSTRSSLSTSSQQASEPHTPPSSTYRDAVVPHEATDDEGKLEENDGHALLVSEEAMDALLTSGDLPVDLYPSSPHGTPLSIRISPSPFLTQDEVAVLHDSQHAHLFADDHVHPVAAEHAHPVAAKHVSPVTAAPQGVAPADPERAAIIAEVPTNEEKALAPLPENETPLLVQRSTASHAVNYSNTPAESENDLPPPPVPQKPYDSRSFAGQRSERDVGERTRLDLVEARALELEGVEEELERTRDALELLRLDLAHTKEEARRTTKEANWLRKELERVKAERERERDESRAQVAALEAQLGTIRTVLLGKTASW